MIILLFKVISESEKVEKCKSGRVHSRLTQEAIKLQRSSASGLMSLLRLFGFIYAEVSRYNFREAIKRIQQLPEQHAKSSWVMSLLGKCYFELSEYREAADYLRQVREQDPYRLEMMDYYSTALWHLQVPNLLLEVHLIVPSLLLNQFKIYDFFLTSGFAPSL